LADQFEPDNSSSEATKIDLRETQRHSIHAGGDVDYVWFDLPRSMTVTIETSGQTGMGYDLEMWLYDTLMTQLDYDDDSGADQYAQITTTLAAGAYYVEVRAFDPQQLIPEYHLTVATPDNYKIVDLTSGWVTEQATVPDLLTNDEYRKTKLVLKRIPAGSFDMGDEVGGHGADETPVHTVNIPAPFYLGVFEVTQKQWNMIQGTWPSYFYGWTDYERRPVDSVSWDDCQAFLSNLSSYAGLNARLPTEAEWEYACKAGTHTNYHFGDSEDGAYMWYQTNSGGENHFVGAKKASPWGLFDMHGNVWEWCEDWYESGYYSASPADDPKGPSSGTYRVLRGGAWDGSTFDFLRSSARGYLSPSNRDNRHGFRVALSGDPVYKVVDLSSGVVEDVNSIPDLTTNDIYRRTKLVLKRIDPGSFQMGDEVGGHDTDETPVHTVNITRRFYMGVFEVTQKQWNMIQGTWPSSFYAWSSYERRPVEQVSWDDCQNFLWNLSSMSGYSLRLPTEAEWEYACKAGTSTYYSYGDSENGSYMWYSVNAGSQTNVVGTKLANPWGLYDVHGNVFEWCGDWYDSTYYSWSAADDPVGPSSGASRVLRGGSWNYDGFHSRSANRSWVTPTNRDMHIGLRAVLEQ
jgi:formylglycine-generating enzyme required for sulfatase activity